MSHGLQTQILNELRMTSGEDYFIERSKYCPGYKIGYPPWAAFFSYKTAYYVCDMHDAFEYSITMGSSAAEYCLTRHEMQLSGNEIERIVYGYVVPFFVLFGTIGNVVSLMVLLSPPMRSRWPGNRTNPNPIWLQRFAYWSRHVHAMLVVFIPTLIIVVANVALLATLKQRNHLLLSLNGHSSDILTSQARIEQKITCAVCAIVTCFTITQAPSALVPTTFGYLVFGGPVWKQNLQILTNCMVVIGKSLNFALFCLSSNTFRERLVELCRHKCDCRDSRKFTALVGYTHISNSTRKSTLTTQVDMPACRIAPNKQRAQPEISKAVRRSLSSHRKPDALCSLITPRRAISINIES
ncbi:Putative G-protein coupled receptor F59B2.13 [Toxocara canis]|uniref:Putative G-protein coupled receptor F59B2.13 n=1 Tax=Toxocara canis TaxID=6265 RepID=A0A0B2VHJ6_TOXCA|nr:Putative G-protein coupled receptor F59B2.13 [Toxocara canis]